jgi:hypothetical protein
MKKKKKFDMSLDEELKPDLTYYVEHIEHEMKSVANKIFGVSEDEPKQKPFDIKEIYKTKRPAAKKKQTAEWTNILEQAQKEAMADAAKLFDIDFSSDEEESE